MRDSNAIIVDFGGVGVLLVERAIRFCFCCLVLNPLWVGTLHLLSLILVWFRRRCSDDGDDHNNATDDYDN